MAYEFNEPAYYGDMTPTIGPYSPGYRPPAKGGVREEVEALMNGDLYVRDASTGLLHAISARTASGVTTITIEQNGVPKR